MSGEFSVALFFPDESYEYVRRFVGAEEAVTVAKSYTERPSALIGMIRRVIITDGGDCTAFEWIYGEGITYPPHDPETDCSWGTTKNARNDQIERPSDQPRLDRAMSLPVAALHYGGRGRG